MAGRYVAKCTKACFWQKQYWPIGREYSGMKKPPAHLFDLGDAAKETENDTVGGNK